MRLVSSGAVQHFVGQIDFIFKSMAFLARRRSLFIGSDLYAASNDEACALQSAVLKTHSLDRSY